MKHASQAVSTKVTNHRHTLRLYVTLDRVANIPKGVTGLCCLNPQHQRIMGYLDQAFGLAGQFACHIHPARITIPTIYNDRHIDVQDITVFQLFITGDAVANHMVHADTASVLVPAIPDGR